MPIVGLLRLFTSSCLDTLSIGYYDEVAGIYMWCVACLMFATKAHRKRAR